MKAKVILGVIASLAALCGAGPAVAEFPDRHVTIILPSAAGGPNDVMARRLAIPLGKALNTSVVIENVVGGGSTIGYSRVINARPDGYTLLVANVGISAVSAIYGRPDLDPRTRLDTLGLFALTPITILTRKDLPVNTLAELRKLGQSSGSKLNMGNAGPGSGSHLTGAHFNTLAGMAPTEIPYRGTGPALTALAASEIDYMTDLSATAVPLARHGKIKMLAVASTQRLPGMPDVPTVVEAGLPDYIASGWLGLFLPKNVPADVVKKLQAGLTTALTDPAFRSSVTNDFNSGLPTPEQATPEGFRQFLEAEVRRWHKVVADEKITAAQ